MQLPLTISATYREEDLKMLYFGHSGARFLRQNIVRKNGLAMIVCSILGAWSYHIAVRDDEPTLIIGSFLMLLMILMLVVQLAVYGWKFYRWKRAVYHTICPLYGSTETIECSQDAITFSNDRETVIAKWSQVNQVKIAASHILLYTGTDMHILPSASMSAKDYQLLSDILSDKIG